MFQWGLTIHRHNHTFNAMVICHLNKIMNKISFKIVEIISLIVIIKMNIS